MRRPGWRNQQAARWPGVGLFDPSNRLSVGAPPPGAQQRDYGSATLPEPSKSLIRAGSLTSSLSRVQGEIARDKLAALMPQFVIEREVPGAGSLSEDQIRELSLRSLETLKAMGPQIQWLHSYVTEDKVYCVYLAPDEESIRQHARRTGIPADRVSAVRRLIDPAKLR